MHSACQVQSKFTTRTCTIHALGAGACLPLPACPYCASKPVLLAIFLVTPATPFADPILLAARVNEGPSQMGHNFATHAAATHRGSSEGTISRRQTTCCYVSMCSCECWGSPGRRLCAAPAGGVYSRDVGTVKCGRHVQAEQAQGNARKPAQA